MKKNLILSLLLLAGCSSKDLLRTSPAQVGSNTEIVIDGQSVGKAPAPKMPELPDTLAKIATALPPLKERTVAGQQKEGVETDRLYNAVAVQLNSVIKAWGCVREALNDQKDAKGCFKD